MADGDTVSASIAAGVAEDLAGNLNTISSSTDNSVLYDISAPSVVLSSLEPNPTNGTFSVTATFSEPVYGFTLLDLALVNASAGSLTGAGGDTLYTFDLTPGIDGLVSVTVPATSATDLATNPNTISNTLSRTFDGTPPSVTINEGALQADPTNASPIVFDVLFSEGVYGFTAAEVTLSSGTAAITSGIDGAAAYTVEVSGMADGDTVSASIAAGVAEDLAGNLNTISSSTDNSVLYDISAPSVVLSSLEPNPTNGTFSVTATFSEPVYGFTLLDLTLVNASAGSLTGAGGDTLYTFDLTPGIDGLVSVTVPATSATDLATNPNTISNTLSRTFDGTPPSVTINEGALQADPTNASPIVFDVLFSEGVYGFTAAEVTLSSGTAAITSGIDGAAAYTVEVSGMADGDTVSASIAAGVAEDLAGNLNTISSSTDNSVLYDISAPSVVLSSLEPNPTNGTFSVTATFSEPVYGFTLLDLTLVNASAGSLTGAGGDTLYTFDLTPGIDGLVSVTVPATSATDLATNPNTISNTLSRTFDGTPPSVTINEGALQADPTNASPIVFDVLFSEGVYGFTAAEVTLSSGTAAITSGIDGAAAYTVEVSGMADGDTVSASIAAGVAEDLAGNLNTISSSTDNSVLYDISAPSVVLSSLEPNPTNGTFSVTATFSEPVYGFTLLDLTLVNASAGSLTGAGGDTLYTFDLTPGIDGLVSVTVPATSATDLATNPNTISNTLSRTFDGTPPSVTINEGALQADPTNADPIVFDVLFSEGVYGFTAAEVTLSSGTAAITSGIDGAAAYTVEVSGMADGDTVSASIAAGVAEDLAGNLNTISSSTDNSVLYDVLAPSRHHQRWPPPGRSDDRQSDRLRRRLQRAGLRLHRR